MFTPTRSGHTIGFICTWPVYQGTTIDRYAHSLIQGISAADEYISLRGVAEAAKRPVQRGDCHAALAHLHCDEHALQAQVSLETTAPNDIQTGDP